MRSVRVCAAGGGSRGGWVGPPHTLRTPVGLGTGTGSGSGSGSGSAQAQAGARAGARGLPTTPPLDDRGGAGP